MTAAHEAVKRAAKWMAEVAAGNPWCETNHGHIAIETGVPIAQIPQIVADLRARGEWPEGLRVAGEGQK
jgi:endonuclease V-like protein UPF0215 family